MKSLLVDKVKDIGRPNTMNQTAISSQRNHTEIDSVEIDDIQAQQEETYQSLNPRAHHYAKAHEFAMYTFSNSKNFSSAIELKDRKIPSIYGRAQSTLGRSTQVGTSGVVNTLRNSVNSNNPTETSRGFNKINIKHINARASTSMGRARGSKQFELNVDKPMQQYVTNSVTNLKEHMEQQALQRNLSQSINTRRSIVKSYLDTPLKVQHTRVPEKVRVYQNI